MPSGGWLLTEPMRLRTPPARVGNLALGGRQVRKGDYVSTWRELKVLATASSSHSQVGPPLSNSFLIDTPPGVENNRSIKRRQYQMSCFPFNSRFSSAPRKAQLRVLGFSRASEHRFRGSGIFLPSSSTSVRSQRRSDGGR